MGQFKNNVRSGKGTFIWSTGKSYIGNWLNGKQHGLGIFIDSQENAKEGIWE